ncbi:MAG: hypothetical protein HRT67_07880 [Flavobacteriaceae bacterium]|nr:hypothetical protein [Flavobacteriaceae bacterium]
MLLVYTPHITPRIKYVFKQICTRILNIEVSFTNTVEDFIAHDSLKMSYASQQLGNEFFVRHHPILSEHGLSDIDINVQDWDETKCFFYNGDKSSIPFDIFAASFYLLSRYEEYLPHVKDEYGRFTIKESLAYKHNFLLQPVVDIWANKFRSALEDKYSNFNFPKRNYQIDLAIDVPMAYYFKHKGLMRIIGGTFGDVFQFKFKRLYQRLSVLLGFKKDPYDTYKWILNKQKQIKSKLTVFFLIGDFSTYDKNISINKKQFVSLIKSIGDYCRVGLKVSYFAVENPKILKKEKRNMEAIINTALKASRNSFSKLYLPKTYRSLIELEIQEDYTMGYVNDIGFRAGTCTPFYFYEIDYETQTPLMIKPFCFMDAAALKIKSQLDKRETLERLIQEVKKVNGTFTAVFHNYSFSNEERWKGFKKLFTLILNSTHEN